MEYYMTNAELREAINNTIASLRPAPLCAPINQRSAELLNDHLEKLLEIERARAAAISVPLPHSPGEE